MHIVGAIMDRPAEGKTNSPQSDANTNNLTARAVDNRPYERKGHFPKNAAAL